MLEDNARLEKEMWEPHLRRLESCGWAIGTGPANVRIESQVPLAQIYSTLHLIVRRELARLTELFGVTARETRC